VQRVRIPGGLFLSRPVSSEAPQTVLNKQVEIDIRSDVPTLADLQILLEAQGVPVTIDWRSLEAGAGNSGRIESFNVASRYDCLSKSAAVGRGIVDGSLGFGGIVGGSGAGRVQSGISGIGNNGSSNGSDPCNDDNFLGAFEEASKNGDGFQEEQATSTQQERFQENAVQGQDPNAANQQALVAGRVAPAFYDRVVPFRYFRGSIGELMRRLENTGNIAVWYENGIVIGDVRRYSVAVLQNRDVVQSTVNELRKLGAKDVLGSVGAGQVFYSSPPRTNNEVIEPYLRRLAGNLSEITMQVALVTVSMSKEAEAGFDWSKFNFGVDQNINSAPDPLDSKIRVELPNDSGVFNNGVFGLNVDGVFGKLLSVGGAIKYLSKMGNTNIAQNVELRTLSGSPVLLRSGEQIPYVKNVNAVSTGGSLGGSSAQGSETQILGTGLTLNVDPRYDSSSGIVTMDVGIKLVDLVEFVQLNAGQLGTLTQPRTREQAVNSILRVPAGQTTILGGIRRDLSIKSRTGPFGAYGIGSRESQNEVFWLFAIVRPVITVYETADAPIAPRSILDTRTTINPYDEGSYGSADRNVVKLSRGRQPIDDSKPVNTQPSGATEIAGVPSIPQAVSQLQAPDPASYRDASSDPSNPDVRRYTPPVKMNNGNGTASVVIMPDQTETPPKKSFVRPMTTEEKNEGN
jgi:hypothetical protein